MPIRRGCQEKSGIKKTHTSVGGIVVERSPKFPIGTLVSFRAKDLDFTKDKVWCKGTFPDTWDTQIVRGVVRYAGSTEWGVLWETDKRRSMFKESDMVKFLAFEQEHPR